MDCLPKAAYNGGMDATPLYDWLVIGHGFAGTAAAAVISDTLGQSVHLTDRRASPDLAASFSASKEWTWAHGMRGLRTFGQHDTILERVLATASFIRRLEQRFGVRIFDEDEHPYLMVVADNADAAEKRRKLLDSGLTATCYDSAHARKRFGIACGDGMLVIDLKESHRVYIHTYMKTLIGLIRTRPENRIVYGETMVDYFHADGTHHAVFINTSQERRMVCARNLLLACGENLSALTCSLYERHLRHIQDGDHPGLTRPRRTEPPLRLRKNIKVPQVTVHVTLDGDTPFIAPTVYALDIHEQYRKDGILIGEERNELSFYSFATLDTQGRYGIKMGYDATRNCTPYPERLNTLLPQAFHRDMERGRAGRDTPVQVDAAFVRECLEADVALNRAQGVLVEQLTAQLNLVLAELRRRYGPDIAGRFGRITTNLCAYNIDCIVQPAAGRIDDALGLAVIGNSVGLGLMTSYGLACDALGITSAQGTILDPDRQPDPQDSARYERYGLGTPFPLPL